MARAVIEPVVCGTWPDAKRRFAALKGWAFRGQADTNWNLCHSLERAAAGRMGEHTMREVESETVEAFQRHAHHYLTDELTPRSAMEWRALMQHHGAPTRLLDLTWSPYVAAYFALEESHSNGCAVWAFNIPALVRIGIDYLDSKVPEFVKSLGCTWDLTALMKQLEDWATLSSLEGKLLEQKTWSIMTNESYHAMILGLALPGVFPVDVVRRNLRMTVQQGLFLTTGHPGLSCWDNLQQQILRLRPGEPISQYIQKFTIPFSERNDALCDLDLMNVNRITLFPGLDGFAQSLKYRINRTTVMGAQQLLFDLG